MSKYFRFQLAENFNAVHPAWHVTHKRSEAYVGEVRLAAASNYEARRPAEAHFHGTYASRVQAARWLKNAFSEPAVFDDVEEDDEESDNSN